MSPSFHYQPTNQDPVFQLPPYKVQRVFKSTSESIDWGMEMLSIPQYWRFTAGQNIKVAVLDTGIDFQHPELQDAIVEAADFTGSRSGPSDSGGHGTHVAGIIAARRNNAGIIGVAPECDLLVAKVLGDNGSGTGDGIASAIYWAVDKGADIISMSLGSPFALDEVHRAIQYAINQNRFVICAAGNEGPDLGTVSYPAAYVETIAVGSIDRQRKISGFSSRGREVDIVAPGDHILSTYPPSGFAELSGTSMATPFVAGIVALVLSKHRTFGGNTPINNQNELIDHLVKTAIDLGEDGFDPDYGFGLINPRQLLGSDDNLHSAKELVLFLGQDITDLGVHKVQKFLAGKENLNGSLEGQLRDQNSRKAGKIKLHLS